jgi:hypothetical protein
MAWLMRRLGVPDLLVLILCALLALHPTFLIYGRWLFYTVPIALLVTLSAVAAVRFVETGRSAWASAFAWVAATLMLTRAIFHPVWFGAALGLIMLPLDGASRRRLVLAALVPLAVVLLWYTKNAVEVGSFGASSWLGMNLRKGWQAPREHELAPGATQRPSSRAWSLSADEARALRDSGELPREWLRTAFAPPIAFRDLGYFRRRADGSSTHPALDAVTKTEGGPNFNHRDYARIAREVQRGNLVVMWKYPWRYLQRVGRATWMFLQPGPRFTIFGRKIEAALGELTTRSNRVLFLSGVVGGPPGDSPNLLFLLFPAVIVFGAVRSLSGPPHARALFAYASFTLVWFALSTNLLEIGENTRIRFEIDPLVIVLLGCTLTATGSAIARRWTSRSPVRVRRARSDIRTDEAPPTIAASGR